MKRTFTFLFAALFAFMGVWAQLPVTSTAPADGQWNADTKWYTLKVKNGYVSLHNADGNANLMLNNGTLSKNAQSLWCVVGNEADGYQFYNLASGTSKVLGATGSDKTGRMTMYDAAGGVDGVTYRFDIKAKDGNAFVKKQGDNNEWWNDRDNYLSYWDNSEGYGDPGSKCIFTEVDLADFVADYKQNALAALDQWAKLSVVFDAELIAAAKEAINEINTTDYATFAAIDAKLKETTDDVAKKKVTFQTIDVSEASRANVWIAANSSTMKAYGADKDKQDYNAIWSLRHAGGTQFYLYNELNKVYMGAPVNTSDAIVLTQEPQAAYTIEIIDGKGDNVVELHSNGGTIHASNHGDDKLISYDNDADASRWMVNVIDITNDIKDLLATIEENDYADEPRLGQYTKAAYDALVEAGNTAETVEEVEAAIAEFKAAKNLPVFTIDGVISYAAGKSIYDDNDGTLNFKASNVYDKTMWWALDLNKTAVEVADEVGIYNVATGNGFLGATAIKITETNENEGAGIPEDNIFLFYKKGGVHPVHFQDNESKIVEYWSYEATSGSAAKFTYIGSTYDLNKLTDEHIAALSELQATCDANEGLKDVTFGTALGQYSGSKDDLVAALDAAEEIFAKNIVEVAKMEVSAIEAAEAAVVAGAAKITFNAPVDGKYYRIMAVSGWNDDARYLGSKNSTTMDGRAEFVAEADVNTTFLFQGGYLKNYATDLYLVSNSNFLGYNGKQDAGSKIAFYAASNGLAGAFNISFNEDARWLYCRTENYTDAGTRGTENGYCFNIEEVQEAELPALKALCDEFTTQAAEFAELGNGEALSVLKAIKEQQWAPANTTVQALVAKINNNELVLKSEVEEAMGIMESFGYLIMEYTYSYAPAVTEAQGLLAQLEKDSEDYVYLAEGLNFFATATADGLYTASSELNQRVKYLCNIDEAYSIGEADWVEATTTNFSGQVFPLLVNADLTESSWDGESLEGWDVYSAKAFDFDNGIVTFRADAFEVEKQEVVYKRDDDGNLLRDDNNQLIKETITVIEKQDTAAYLKQTIYGMPAGQYRLTGKGYYQGAKNAKMFVGKMDYSEGWNKAKFVVVYEKTLPEATAFGEDLVIEFTLDEDAEDEYVIGYSCDFDALGATMVVGGFKFEMYGALTSTLRKDFQKIYNGGDKYMGVVDFSNLKEMTPYSYFEAMHPAYDALFEEVAPLYYAMIEGNVLKTKVEKAIEDMEAMIAKFKAVADYLQSEKFNTATIEAETAIAGYMEESSVYADLMKAYNAAMGVVYYEEEVEDEIEVMAKYYATFKSVADIEAALKALANALEAAKAKIPTKITLDEEVVLDGELTVQLTATVEGSETADKSVFWVSENEDPDADVDVVTVNENGLVTAVSVGTAYVTAYSIHKSVYAECYVNVKALPTGIDGFEVKVETVIYDIHGRQVEKMEKGFYIVNGKKVLVK